MTKKKKSSEDSQEFSPDDMAAHLAPEVIRAKIQGTWVLTMHPGFPADDWMDEAEEQEVYLIQNETDELRFLGIFEEDNLDGSLDLRLMPFLMGDAGYSFAFSFMEEDEIQFSFGGGFLVMQEDNVLSGVKMHHLDSNIPIYLTRISPDIPEHAEEMYEALLEDDDEGDDDGIFDFEFEDGDPEITKEMMEDFVEFLNRKPESLEELFEDEPKILTKLTSGGIETLEQLMAATDEDLLAIKGIGPGTLNEIRFFIADSNLLEGMTLEVDESLLHRVFTIRVSLDGHGKVYRDIEILGNQTLHDLHTEIQVAFNWDDDHLYSFYMSGVFHDSNTAISHPFAGDLHDSTEVPIAALGLEPERRFVYLFDYGDEWCHTLEVHSIGTTDISEDDSYNYPMVVGSEGTPPAQYEEGEFDEF